MGAQQSSSLTLTRLYPGPHELVDAAVAYAYPAEASRYLRVNMVSSVDGAATLDGRVGSLTGPADQQLLLLLRALADVLVVGAGTIRAEGYGPLTVGPDLAELRAGTGQSPAPRLVVPTRSLDLDLGSAAFTEAVEPPLVVTTQLATSARLLRQLEVSQWWVEDIAHTPGNEPARVMLNFSTADVDADVRRADGLRG